MNNDATEVVAKWREPAAQDECTLYTMGQRAARNACADEIAPAIAELQARCEAAERDAA